MEKDVKSSLVDHNKRYLQMGFLKTAHHSLGQLQTAECAKHQFVTTDKEFCQQVFVKTVNHTLVHSITKDHVLHVFQPKEKSSEKMVPAKNAKITTELCGKIRNVVLFHAMLDNCSKLMEGASIATHTPELQLMERVVFHTNAKTPKDWMKMVVAHLAHFIPEPRVMEPNVAQILAV